VSAAAPPTAATYLGYGLFSLAAHGMSLTIYRLRVENPGAVADVFD
jgi:hypothetical protein